MNDLELAEHEATLGSLIAPLTVEGYRSELISAGPELELPTLVVRFAPDAEGRDRFLTINLVPIDNVEGVDLMLAQLYAPMPFALKAGKRAEFGQFALAVGPSMPVGTLGARDDNEIFIRYMASWSSRSTPDASVLTELVSLIEFQADVFGPAIEAVATTKTTAQAAARMLHDE